jgi:hypothetical protein
MGQNKKGRQPGSGDGPECPILAPSSGPENSGEDAKIYNDYDSYDDGQKSISKGMSSKPRAWRAHAQPVLQSLSLLWKSNAKRNRAAQFLSIKN